MKRNLQLIVLLLLAFTTITSGQQMIEEGNNWNVVDYFWTSGNTNNYSIESDTMVNGILYKQVHLNGEPINTNEFSKTPKYIRETDDGKVFSEDNLQPWDGVDEVLIYDFGLMPGDTFSVGFPNIPAWGSDLVVLSVDTIVLSDGISRRRLVLEGEKPWTLQPTTWVEGIGDVDLGPFHAPKS